MNALKRIVVVLALAGVIPALAAEGPSRAAWMSGRYGLMVHWLYARHTGEPASVNAPVDAFDLSAFLSDFDATGAQWLIFTIGQNTGGYASPNATIDRLCGPGHCSRRDLVAEIARAVKARGKRFVAYLPVDCLVKSIQDGMGWRKDDVANRTFQENWEKVIREWALRLGPNLDGWWFDGAGPGRYPHGFDARLWAAAARAGNPACAVTFCPGLTAWQRWPDGHEALTGVRPNTDECDYLGGEFNFFRNARIWTGQFGVRPESTWMPEAAQVADTRCQTHALFCMDGFWPCWAAWPASWRTIAPFGARLPGHFSQKAMNALRERGEFPEPILGYDEFARFMADYRKVGGGVTVNVGITPQGRLNPKSLDYLRRLARADREAAAYIPEPRPVKSAYEISALYYPGTEHRPEWDMVEQVTPEVKPLLGWYDESDPENVDWQIKWAVEHGIGAFCVCWYWDRGVQRLDHWVKAFYKARFRRHLKWYVMYANHNTPGAHSTADQIAVTRFWIDNYFKTPEYYRIDGKPVVVYCTSFLLGDDFAAEAARKGERLTRAEGIRRALSISEKMAREAGLPGIYWIDMKWLRSPREWTFDPATYAAVTNAGFDAMISYNLGGTTPCGMAGEFRSAEDRPRWCRYDLQVEAAKKLAAMADRLPAPFWPSVPTGYDDVSRAFQRAWSVHGLTPAKFRGACEAVRKACDEKGMRRVVISPINEWQEGSIAEPNEQFGFALYDAIRDTFCERPAEGWPENLTPRDVGRALKEFPPMFFSPVQRWEFAASTEGWYRQPFGCPTVIWADGAIHFVTSSDDQFHIRQRLVPFEAKRYGAFRVRLRVTPNPVRGLGRFANSGLALRLKWGTTDEPIIGNLHAVDFERRVARAPIVADGTWREYALDLTSCRDWQGLVNELWFEAANIGAASVDIDWMRFEPAREP